MEAQVITRDAVAAQRLAYEAELQAIQAEFREMQAQLEAIGARLNENRQAYLRKVGAIGALDELLKVADA